MSFNGFTSPNQHTQTPNEFFEIMYDKNTKFGEVKLLGFLIRNTFGWQRAGKSLQFSFTDLMKATKMSKDTTNNSIKSCLEKQYIQRRELDGQMYYRLNIKDFQDEPWDGSGSFDWKKANNISPKTRPVRKSDQSENQTGPKIRPEAVRKSDQDRSENRTNQNAVDVEPQGVQAVPNKTKEILNKNSISTSTSNNYDLIDSKLKEKYPDAPFDQIKEQLLIDADNGVVMVKTLKQYEAMLKCRLESYVPMKHTRQSKQQSTRKPIRKEVLPDWFDDSPDYHNKQQPKQPKQPQQPQQSSSDDEDMTREIDEMLEALDMQASINAKLESFRVK